MVSPKGTEVQHKTDALAKRLAHFNLLISFSPDEVGVNYGNEGRGEDGNDKDNKRVLGE